MSLERLRASLADRYTIERELGQGGMATVYLAQDLKHDRKVAIKVLRPELAAVLGSQRFLREIETTANLTHPHILPLHDSGEAHGFLYYVMPFIEGETLRDRLLREKQLPLDTALTIARELADALDYAHRHAILHRDIKPENVLLADGHAVLADFGIARALSAAGGERLTETGLAIGTAAYMSPEQAAGERELDGRSDLYSLGSVVYEMLAGEPPFTGPSVQAVLAKRFNAPVPSVRVIREGIPAAVDAALRKAMAKAPADRQATVRQFAEALTAVGRPAGQEDTRALPRGWHRWGIATLALFAAAAVLVWRPWRQTVAPLDPDLVAIAPFDVLDPALQLWREGLGDILSRYLDGAGPLRTVSQTVVVKHWVGQGDRSSAQSLAQRFGAGVVVYGSVVPRGRDSVVLRASVLRSAEGGAVEEIEVAGDQARIGDLADSIGRGILAVLGRSRPIGAIRLASLGAGSLPALKAFLRGEQLYRHGSYDSALVQYDQSLTLDSAFALPYRRMAAILWFDPPTTHSYRDWQDYARRAAALHRGLSSRDSLLVAIVARFAGPGPGEPEENIFSKNRALESMSELAAARYPTDPEVWYFLGEFRYHVGAALGMPLTDQLAAFDHGIALDSAFLPLYEHAPELALRLGQPDRALRYAEQAGALSEGQSAGTNFRLDAAVLDPERAGSPETLRLIDTTKAWRPLWNAMWDLGSWPDSGESAVRIARSFPSPARDYTGAPDFVPDTMVQRWVLAAMLAHRGHLREATALAPKPGPDWSVSALVLGLFGVVPVATMDSFYHRQVATDSLWPTPNGLAWWLYRRDSVSLALMARRADAMAHTHRDPVVTARLGSLATVARASLSLLRGDSAAALRQLEALPDSLCLLGGGCFLRQLSRAQLLVARGRDRDAARVLDQWLPTEAGPFFIVGTLERAGIAERLGDHEAAMKGYQLVLDTWRHPDPELDHYLAEARAGLARVSGEPRR